MPIVPLNPGGAGMELASGRGFSDYERFAQANGLAEPSLDIDEHRTELPFIFAARAGTNVFLLINRSYGQAYDWKFQVIAEGAWPIVRVEEHRGWICLTYWRGDSFYFQVRTTRDPATVVLAETEVISGVDEQHLSFDFIPNNDSEIVGTYRDDTGIRIIRSLDEGNTWEVTL